MVNFFMRIENRETDPNKALFQGAQGFVSQRSTMEASSYRYPINLIKYESNFSRINSLYIEADYTNPVFRVRWAINLDAAYIFYFYHQVPGKFSFMSSYFLHTGLLDEINPRSQPGDTYRIQGSRFVPIGNEMRHLRSSDWLPVPQFAGSSSIPEPTYRTLFPGAIQPL